MVRSTHTGVTWDTNNPTKLVKQETESEQLKLPKKKERSKPATTMSLKYVVFFNKHISTLNLVWREPPNHFAVRELVGLPD